MNATAFYEELGGLYGSRVLEEFGEIIRLYDFYEGKGQLWPKNGQLDYLPTVKRTNFIKKLIKAEAAFSSDARRSFPCAPFARRTTGLHGK